MAEKSNIITEEDKNLEIRGFQLSYTRSFLTCIGVILSCGILGILLSWKKSLFMCCTHAPCTIEDSEKVLIVDSYGQQFISQVNRISPNQHVVHFFYKKMKYNWSKKEGKFVNTRALDIQTCSELFNYAGGLDTQQVNAKRNIYGPNSIEIRVKPILSLILREIKNPFYLYQVICMLIWCSQNYHYFAIAMGLLSIISIAATVWETRKQSKTLRDAMRLKSVATVLRDGKELEIDSEELCPGDVLLFPTSSFMMQCDAVLLSGTCVVNESMLTGESIPITKVPLSNADLDSAFDPAYQHKGSLLSCGTEVLLSRSVDSTRVRAIVYKTGFSTAKGELVRAILYPKPIKFKLYSDFLKCGIVCFAMGIIPMVYTGVISVYKLGARTADTAIFVLNVVTFFFPPALPAVLTSTNEHAQRRLRKQGIYCLNTRFIHVAGCLDVVCFDKTGTLTEDCLDILAAVPVKEGKFETQVKNIENMPSDLLLTAMATCHSLSKINEELVGYDLDIKMFKATGWDFSEPSARNEDPNGFRPPRLVTPKNCQQANSVGILKQFPFESILRRTSVVTVSSDGVYRTFLKGAPELVVSLCTTDTVPPNSKEVIDYHSSQGYRIIGIATKHLTTCASSEQALALSREELESEMQFLGLVVLENKLKEETVPALNLLKDANIRSVIVTGDNILTAITVGRKCGIVDENESLFIIEAKVPSNRNEPKENIQLNVSFEREKQHLFPEEDKNVNKNGKHKKENIVINLERNCSQKIAIDGTTFNNLRNYDKELLEKVVVKGAIFARMLPEDKLYLIEYFQSLGYQVGMCGDGANDCGALKTAHTGVSLSVAEASVAAPFTSKRPDIRCMSTLIREGRATLVSTYDSFKYMMCYTFTFLMAVLFYFWDGQRPLDGAYILIDMILNLAPPFLIGATTAYSVLAKVPPHRSILSFGPIFSFFSFLTIQVAMHVATYTFCKAQPWYEPFTYNVDNPNNPEATYIGTTVLATNMMAYMTAAVAFSTGPPYKMGFFSNKKLFLLITAQFLVVSYIIIYPPGFMISFLNIKTAPDIFYHLNLYGICIGGSIFFIIFERYFVQKFLTHSIVPYFEKRFKPQKKFEKLQEKLKDWPSICSSNEFRELDVNNL